MIPPPTRFKIFLKKKIIFSFTVTISITLKINGIAHYHQDDYVIMYMSWI